MTIFDLFEQFEQQGLLPILELCFHPQQRVTPVSNYYIAKEFCDGQRAGLSSAKILVIIEKKYRISQSRAYAIRKAFSQPINNLLLLPQ